MSDQWPRFSIEDIKCKIGVTTLFDSNSDHTTLLRQTKFILKMSRAEKLIVGNGPITNRAGPGQIFRPVQTSDVNNSLKRIV